MSHECAQSLRFARAADEHDGDDGADDERSVAQDVLAQIEARTADLGACGDDFENIVHTMGVSRLENDSHMNLDELPIVPHSEFGDKECCGCLIVVERGSQAGLVCNECARWSGSCPLPLWNKRLLEMAMARGLCSAICPHCGGLNTFPGWSSLQAHICRECGEGVVIPDRLQ